jgi:hypothetical protein
MIENMRLFCRNVVDTSAYRGSKTVRRCRAVSGWLLEHRTDSEQGTNMAKGQKRSTREAKKPKKDKPKAVAAPALSMGATKGTTGRPLGAKK